MKFNFGSTPSSEDDNAAEETPLGSLPGAANGATKSFLSSKPAFSFSNGKDAENVGSFAVKPAFLSSGLSKGFTPKFSFGGGESAASENGTAESSTPAFSFGQKRPSSLFTIGSISDSTDKSPAAMTFKFSSSSTLSKASSIPGATPGGTTTAGVTTAGVNEDTLPATRAGAAPALPAKGSMLPPPPVSSARMAPPAALPGLQRSSSPGALLSFKGALQGDAHTPSGTSTSGLQAGKGTPGKGASPKAGVGTTPIPAKTPTPTPTHANNAPMSAMSKGSSLLAGVKVLQQASTPGSVPKPVQPSPPVTQLKRGGHAVEHQESTDPSTSPGPSPSPTGVETKEVVEAPPPPPVSETEAVPGQTAELVARVTSLGQSAFTLRDRLVAVTATSVDAHALLTCALADAALKMDLETALARSVDVTAAMLAELAMPDPLAMDGGTVAGRGPVGAVGGAAAGAQDMDMDEDNAMTVAVGAA